MKYFCCTLLTYLFISNSYSQCDFDALSNYKHHQIIEDGDTINYHSFASTSIDSVENVILYIHGSGPEPLFRIETDSFGYQMFSAVPFDLESFPSNYALILVSKKSIPFCIINQSEYEAPESYFKNEKLDYRVFQNDRVINEITKNHSSLKKMIVLGHSEGSDVAAKLCTVNAKISHLAYWSGGGNSQFYDFPLFVSKEMSAGKINQEEALEQYQNLIDQYSLMMAEKDSIDKQWYGNSFTRWAHFNEPPIQSLVKLEIPIYLAMGMADQAVPIESAMLIPAEFARLQKDNLTYMFYPGLDHSFAEISEDGKYTPHWDEVFMELLRWLESN